MANLDWVKINKTKKEKTDEKQNSLQRILRSLPTRSGGPVTSVPDLILEKSTPRWSSNRIRTISLRLRPTQNSWNQEQNCLLLLLQPFVSTYLLKCARVYTTHKTTLQILPATYKVISKSFALPINNKKKTLNVVNKDFKRFTNYTEYILRSALYWSVESSSVLLGLR